ncbi:hypothetical protein V6N13_002175 [Hibiscus sabdariffa]|uniref:BHLH domain-containing protein n=1 Tax=Hibiscus sabdariffa TaxID=183260 RepID=A0ABR2C289_9ROSI
MRALAPFPTPNWPLHEIPLDSQSPAAFFTQTSNFDPCMAKKLNHNASERHRRKKINSMYSSLRSLLPVADQTKKLSFPDTVSHALKYIPELQEQVERLVRKKEELMLRVSEQGGLKFSEEEQPRKRWLSASVAVSTNRMELETACKVGSEEALSEKISALCGNREDLGF